jgi:hypothetical protein
MRNKTGTFRLMFMLVLIFALTALPTSVSANHSWGNYHWARTANPFTLKVGDNVNSTWDPYLNEAISDWNPSSVLNLTKVAGGTRPKNCRATSGRIEACNARYGNNGWLGIAQIWITGGVHITQAITKVNDTYFDTPTYNTPAWRRLVMCQEIAHDFGLDHQDEGFGPPNLGTCMDYTNDPDGGGAYGPSNEHPNQHDFDQLQTIYAHTDSFNSYSGPAASMPPGFANADVHALENWGSKVHESANGRSAIYVRDFGNGFKIITHVIWAE